jgi:hypothetical protein
VFDIGDKNYPGAALDFLPRRSRQLKLGIIAVFSMLLRQIYAKICRIAV